MEKVVEERLRAEVKKMGGLCLKFESPGFNGVPDRIIIMPTGKVFFAELKDKGKRERPIQLYAQRKLREMGCIVFSSVDSLEAVDSVLTAIRPWARCR